MTGVLLGSNLILLAIVLGLGYRTLKKRADRKQRGLLRRWPIPTVPLEQFDERFTPGPFGPTLGTEVSYVGHGPLHVPGGTTDFEAWILAVLAKNAVRLFEFGTCTGKTAYLWARNLPPAGTVTTLTLGPDQLDAYVASPQDRPRDTQAAQVESQFTRFLYSGTDVESKVVQLFGDSKQLDETPWVGTCDVVFVDGSHAYSYVRSDSGKALRMVKPDGLVLWHDYSPRHGGVFRALNELARALPLVHIARTSLVAYRRPVDRVSPQ